MKNSTLLRWRPIVALLAAVTACGGSDPAAGGADSAKMLSGGNELAHPFTELRAITELPDGRLVAHDQKEPTLLLVDFTANTAVPLGRTGSGPVEYGTQGSILVGGGDSAFYYDRQQRRVLVISPTGVPVRTARIDAGNPIEKGGMFLPTAIDLAGRVYGQTLAMKGLDDEALHAESMLPSFADTMEVKRIDLRDGKIEALARMRSEIAKSTPAMEMVGGRTRMTITSNDYRPSDVWAAMPDGRVAVLRDGIYRVEFFGNGAKTLGPTIPATPVPITAAERKAAFDSLAAEIKEEMKNQTDFDTAAFEIGIVEPKDAANTKPLYTSIRASPTGLLWVSTPTPGVGGGERYDVLDSTGALLWSTLLPKGEYLICVGRRAVYTQRKDADDFHFIRRYTLPPPVAR